jgi:hypothetical protein
VSAIYEVSINVHFSSKVSLKVKEEVSMKKWRGKLLEVQATGWEMPYNLE